MFKEGAFHRNSFKRFYGEGKIYFVVTKTKHNFPYFKELLFCDLLIEELRLCKRLKKLKLYAFSIIYDHINLLLQPGDKYNISQAMKSLKENASRDINYVINDSSNVGDTSTCRLHLRGVIEEYRRKFLKKHGYPQYEIPPFRWQKSFYDHTIRGEKDFYTHCRYTVYNPAKHGLTDDWPYTSLEFEDLIDHIEW